MIEEAIVQINTRQNELTKALVDGGNDLNSDNKIRGEIIGLEHAKHIIHALLEESAQNDSGIPEDEDE